MPCPSTSRMFLSLVVVTSLVTLGLSTTYDTTDDLPNIDWDFIIVGGGTAGSVLASRLTENPCFNVLLLEAGPTNEHVTNSIVPGLQQTLANTRYDWNYTTTPQLGLNNRSLHVQRGHILGGTTSVNGMIYTRGSVSDYDRIAESSRDPGWSWNNVQQYFRKFEKFQEPTDHHNITNQYNPEVHSTTGRTPVTLPGFSYPQIDSLAMQAGDQLGGKWQYNQDMNSGTPLGLGWVQSTIGYDGTRSSAATAYLDDRTRARENLYIVTSTRVTRVLPMAGTGSLTIRTVEVRVPGTSRSVNFTASKEVILSCGSIGSPFILMHSGIASAEQLEKFGINLLLDNRSVGSNLTDHAFVGVSFDVESNSLDLGRWANLSTDPTLQREALQIWNTNRSGPYVVVASVSHVAWTRLAKNITEDLGDPSSGPDSPHLELVMGALSPAAYNIFILFVSPSSRGTLTIGSNNPFDDPRIDPAILTTEFDIVAVREAVKEAITFSGAPVFRSIISGVAAPFTNVTTDAEIDNIVRNIATIGDHLVGTASMSPKGANWGVVDPDLTVKNVQGLRVVDASVMPFVPSAHTQAMTYIIAERAADLIHGSWE